MSNRHQELTSPEQTAPGKDFPNPLIVDVARLLMLRDNKSVHSWLLSNYMVIIAPYFSNEAMASPKQTAIGKDSSNPFMAEYHPPTPHDSPLYAVHSHGSEEGSLKLQELMNLVNTLSDRIGVLEADLLKTKKTYSSAYTKLILRVKKLDDGALLADLSPKTGGKLFLKRFKKKLIPVLPKVNFPHSKSRLQTEVIHKQGVAVGKQVMRLVCSKDRKLSYAEAIRLEEQMNEEQRAQIARDAEIARQWDEEERKRAMDEAKATKKIDWNDPSNQGNFKITDFKGMSYNEIRPIFEKLWDFNQKFVPMDAKKERSISLEKERSKSAEKERSKSPEKIEEEKVVTQEEKEEVVKESGAKRKKEEVPIEVESISTKFPIMDWKSYVLTETFMYYQIFRGNSRPGRYDLDVGDLHTMFEPNEDDELWRNQQYNLISWSLYDLCGVHMLLMENGMAIHMLTEKKYPLSQEMISKMLKKRLEVDHDSTQAIELLRFIRS
ncbi:hypothetical protein Tco_0779148 [Tanacetum coccineum]